MTALLLIGTKLGIDARKLQDDYDYSSETAGWGSSDGETQDDYDYSQETIGWGSNTEESNDDGETPDLHDYSNETTNWGCFEDWSVTPFVPCEWEVEGRYDMCLDKFPGYTDHDLPTLNPYCCRMFKKEDDNNVAFEDFCASSHSFATYLDSCEMKFTDI